MCRHLLACAILFNHGANTIRKPPNAPASNRQPLEPKRMKKPRVTPVFLHFNVVFPLSEMTGKTCANQSQTKFY